MARSEAKATSLSLEEIEALGGTKVGQSLRGVLRTALFCSVVTLG